ncbi:MAG: hypothetical protein EOP56_18095 [Sphingobacteriales bacterium]|nr:MAG: hypothetical protein EOP56_18095 [Sphingobacteriales bacterium]
MREEFNIKAIQVLQATQGASKYNIDQVTRLAIGYGLNSQRVLPKPITPDSTGVISQLGNEVMGPLYLGTSEEGTDQTIYGVDGRPYTIKAMRIDTNLVTIDYVKKASITEIEGSTEFIIESSGYNDAQVTIEGKITSNQNGVYPFALVERFNKIVYASAIVPVIHWRLNFHDIVFLIIEGVDMLPMRGYRSHQDFIIRAYSHSLKQVNVKVNP